MCYLCPGITVWSTHNHPASGTDSYSKSKQFEWYGNTVLLLEITDRISLDKDVFASLNNIQWKDISFSKSKRFFENESQISNKVKPHPS